MTLGSPNHPIRTLYGAAVVVATLVSTAAAAQSTGAMPRVRSEDSRIAHLIADASVLSPSFRELVTAIDATDGIIYVAAGRCGRGARACLANSLQVAGPHRILRVVVNTRRDCEELIGAIGHELHHALEILREPKIRTSQAMFFHFLGESESLPNRFETNGASEVGARIEGELRIEPGRCAIRSREREASGPVSRNRAWGSLLGSGSRPRTLFEASSRRWTRPT